MCGPLGCGSHGPVEKSISPLPTPDQVEPHYRTLIEKLTEARLIRGFRPWAAKDPSDDSVVDVNKERIWFEVHILNLVYRYGIWKDGELQ